MTPIAPLIEAFLDETLARQRGVSRHTRDSYALSFQLLFMFAAKRLKVSPSSSAPSWSILRISAKTRR
jgi:integrase/recombinase XerD